VSIANPNNHKVLGFIKSIHPNLRAAPQLPIKDKEDPWIIACALQANVEAFVTGDAELLGLGKANKLPIISPRECWQKLG